MLAYAFCAQFASSQTHLHDCKRSNNKITEKRREDKRRTADIKHESHNIHSFIRVQHSLIPFSVSKIKLQLKRSRLEIVYTHNTNAHMKWNRSNACETRIRLCSFRCIRQHPANWKKNYDRERTKSVKVIYIHFLERCRFMRTKHDDALKYIQHTIVPIESHGHRNCRLFGQGNGGSTD